MVRGQPRPDAGPRSLPARGTRCCETGHPPRLSCWREHNEGDAACSGSVGKRIRRLKCSRRMWSASPLRGPGGTAFAYPFAREDWKLDGPPPHASRATARQPSLGLPTVAHALVGKRERRLEGESSMGSASAPSGLRRDSLRVSVRSRKWPSRRLAEREDSNPRADYSARRFRGAPVTTTSVPLLIHFARWGPFRFPTSLRARASLAVAGAHRD